MPASIPQAYSSPQAGVRHPHVHAARNETIDPVPPAEALRPPGPDDPQNLPPAPTVQTVRQVVGIDGSGGMTYARLPVKPAYSAPYDPTAAFADPRAQAVAPNVDFASQTVAQGQALDAYRLNARLFEGGNEALKTLLDIKT